MAIEWGCAAPAQAYDSALEVTPRASVGLCPELAMAKSAA